MKKRLIGMLLFVTMIVSLVSFPAASSPATLTALNDDQTANNVNISKEPPEPERSEKEIAMTVPFVNDLDNVFLSGEVKANEPTEPAPEVSIVACNLSFQDSIYIKYAVSADDISAVKMLIWTTPQTEYVYGTHSAEMTPGTPEKVGGEMCAVFQYRNIFAKQMTDSIYARAYIEREGVRYYSEVKKYSVLQYAYNKTGRTGTASTNQKLIDLLNDMLQYGSSAQKYLNYKTSRLATMDFYQVKVVGGWLDDMCDIGLYLPGDNVTITAPQTNEDGNVFWCWKNSADEKVSYEATFTVDVGTQNEVYTASYISLDELYTRVGNYIYFGSYPQSEVIDEELKQALTDIAGSTDTWTSYEYYIEGETSDYMVYTDVSCGGERYRGVFFTTYRPYFTTNMDEDEKQDNNGYYTNTVYWFKYEPIKWRILSETNGDIFLCTELVLDAQDFHYTEEQTNGYYANNYEHSHIRAWLQDSFYNTAFSDTEKIIIKTTEVDNSATSGGYSDTYACNDTSDKIFLLSCAEVLNSELGFDDYSYRIKAPTAYAKAQGVVKDDGFDDDEGAAWWWLRTPGSAEYYAYDINKYGWEISYNDVSRSAGGISPALHLMLSADEPVPDPTYVLSFSLNEDGQSYSVTGIDVGSSTDIVIPSIYNGLSVTNIDQGVFMNCGTVTSVTIPDTVTFIGHNAFAYCDSLTSIFYEGTLDQWNEINLQYWWNYRSADLIVYCSDGNIPEIDRISRDEININNQNLVNYSFNDVYSEIVVPEDSIGTDLRIWGWVSTHSEIRGFEYSIDGGEIVTGDFAVEPEAPVVDNANTSFVSRFEIFVPITEGDYTITAYVVTENTTAVIWIIDVSIVAASTETQSLEYTDNGDGTCTITGLGTYTGADVQIPEMIDGLQVTSIGSFAFYGCTDITSISIPDSVTSINNFAFAGCGNLTNIYYEGTIDQWSLISLGNRYCHEAGNFVIHCSDGILTRPQIMINYRDQITLNDEDLALHGDNDIYTEVVVPADSIGSDLRIWGWVGTLSAIQYFGYSIDDGDIITGDYFVYDELVISAAQPYYASRYEIFAPIAEGEHLIKVYVLTENATELVWKIRVSTAVIDPDAQFTVVWMNYDGEVLETDIVSYGETPVYDGPEPVKLATNEYTFSFGGWDKEVGQVTQDETYTAVFIAYPVNYSITYDLDGGTADNPDSYNIESDIIVLQEPVKAGYNFVGWTGSNGETPEINVTIDIGNLEDLSYTAHWELAVYSISYNLYGGENAIDNPSTYTLLDDFTLLPATRTGYTFDGWYLYPDMTGSVSNISNSFGDIELYAKWVPKSYTCKFVNEGGILLDYPRVKLHFPDRTVELYISQGDINPYALLLDDQYRLSYSGGTYGHFAPTLYNNKWQIFTGWRLGAEGNILNTGDDLEIYEDIDLYYTTAQYERNASFDYSYYYSNQIVNETYEVGSESMPGNFMSMLGLGYLGGYSPQAFMSGKVKLTVLNNTNKVGLLFGGYDLYCSVNKGVLNVKNLKTRSTTRYSAGTSNIKMNNLVYGDPYQFLFEYVGNDPVDCSFSASIKRVNLSEANYRFRTVTFDDDISAPRIIGRDGYDFIGWFDSEGNKVEKWTYDSDQTLYARFEPIDNSAAADEDLTLYMPWQEMTK